MNTDGQVDLFGASPARARRSPGPHSPMSGRFLKEQGQKRALDGAGPEWSARALALLRDWLTTRRGELVVFEDFRAQIPLDAHPASAKAWGALPRMAVKAKLIASTGDYAKARSPRTHAHPVALWRVL